MFYIVKLNKMQAFMFIVHTRDADPQHIILRYFDCTLTVVTFIAYFCGLILCLHWACFSLLKVTIQSYADSENMLVIL